MIPSIVSIETTNRRAWLDYRLSEESAAGPRIDSRDAVASWSARWLALDGCLSAGVSELVVWSEMRRSSCLTNLGSRSW
jgi:hypothetical protein